MTNIVYEANNCGLAGPSSASSGQQVNVSVTPLDNASITNDNIKVTKGTMNIAFSFNGSILTFYMP